MGLTIVRAGQTRIATLDSDLQVTEANADSVAAWWTANGTIPASDVAGVWTPKGKANLAASYLRDAGSEGYANIDPAIVGGVAPTWDAVNGWKGNGLTTFLKTGIFPASGWSAFCRISGAVSTSAKIFGTYAASTRNFGIYNNYFGYVYFDNGGESDGTAPGVDSGSLSIAGNSGYRNGVYDSAIPAWSGGSTSPYDCCILAANSLGSVGGNLNGYMTHFAIYKTTLTAPQNAALTAATV